MKTRGRKLSVRRFAAILVSLFILFSPLSDYGSTIFAAFAEAPDATLDDVDQSAEEAVEPTETTEIEPAGEPVTTPEPLEGPPISDVPTEAPAPDAQTPTAEPTAEPSVETPTAMTLIATAIEVDGYAYVLTSEEDVGVYLDYAMHDAQRIGTLAQENSLLFADEYVARDTKSAAIKVWFDTADGRVSGYVSEKRLKASPIALSDVAKRIEDGKIEIDAWADVGKTLPRFESAYVLKGEEEELDHPDTVLYEVTITLAEDPSIRLRKYAEQDSSSTGAAQNGATVSVLSEEGEWCWVRTEDGTEGYVRAQYLVKQDIPGEPNEAPTEEAPIEEPTEMPTVEPSIDENVIGYATVTTDGAALNLRAEASLEGQILTSLENGTRVAVLGFEGEWTRVRADGTEGYVEGYAMSEYLAMEEAASDGPNEEPEAGFVPVAPKDVPTYYLPVGEAYFEPVDPESTEQGSLGASIYALLFPAARAEEGTAQTADIYSFIGSDGVTYYRVYGMLNGVEGWYACDESGNITGTEPIDLAEEQNTLASGTPSISLLGLANFSLTPPATPPTVPDYYTSYPAGENTTVYTFVGRDGVSYYRIYGTNELNEEGFFECDQYGENEGAHPLNMDDEYNTIAPFDYTLQANSSVPVGLTIHSTNPYVYQFTDQWGAIEYRAYAVKKNDPADTAQHWYECDASGNIGDMIPHDDIQLNMDNLWENGFIENFDPANEKPDYYGSLGSTENANSILFRSVIWGFTDRNNVPRYRILGAVMGVAGFYECDVDGNITNMTPVDLEDEYTYLSPLQDGIAPEYIPGYAKISSTQIIEMLDGTSYWDGNTSGIDTATLGNDANAGNKVVRSFDQVIYSLDYVTQMNTQLTDGTDISNYKGFFNANVYVRFEVPVSSASDVSLDTDAMQWLKDAKQHYDSATGKYVLTGYRALGSSGATAVLPNRGTLNVVMKVNGAANGQTLTPSCSVWLDQGEGNNESYVPTSAETTTGIETVRVTAAPKYNAKVVSDLNVKLSNYYDLTTGTIGSGSLYGSSSRIFVLLMIDNDNPSKGLKGVEFPSGPITVSMKLTYQSKLNSSSTWTTMSDYPRLWDAQTNEAYTSSNPDFKTTGDWYGRTLIGLSKSNNLSVSDNYEPVGVGGNRTLGNNNVYDNGDVTNVSYDSATGMLTFQVNNYETDGIFPTSSVYRNYAENEGVFSVPGIAFMLPCPTSVAATTDYRMNAKITSFNATSVSGTVTTSQMDITDDETATGFTLYPVGAYTKGVYLSDGSGSNLLSSFYNSEDAKAVRGQTIGVRSWMGTDSSNLVSADIYAADVLTKFDAAAFEPTGVWRLIGQWNNMHVNILYGTLPSGGDWTSRDQMETTRKGSLTWHTSLAALGTKKCVAILYEAREGHVTAGLWDNDVFFSQMKVPMTATEGVVYQVVVDEELWQNTKGSTMTAAVYTATNPSVTYPAADWTFYTNPTAISGVPTVNFVEATYNSVYQMTDIGQGNYQAGQSLLIIGETVKVSKSVEQLNGTVQKANFDLNANERKVDYAITPLHRLDEAGGISTVATTVTVTDTLPAGLTYVSGSSYVGGTYVQGDTSQSGYVEGGTAQEPSVTANANGTTTLVWTFPNHYAGTEMKVIHFSAIIGDEKDPANDPNNGTALTNTVAISAPTCKLYQSLANGNQFVKTITVTNLADVSLTKEVVEKKLEIEEDVVYKMVVKNNSSTNVANVVVLDNLPYIGDARGTQFHGDYIVSTITIETTSAANTNLTLKTTTDTSKRSEDSTTVSMTNWVSHTGVANGKTVTYTINSKPVALLFESANLEADSRAVITITLKPSDNEYDNIYANDATMYGTNFSNQVVAPVVSARVVVRMVNGFAWVDVNENGARDSGEVLLEGILVRLFSVTRDAGGTITAVTPMTEDITGTPFGNVYTDATGAYSFVKLPAGEIQVRFYGGMLPIDDWKVTTYHAPGVSVRVDCDAVGEYTGETLDYAVINDLVLPEKEDLEIGIYELRRRDVGFYAPLALEKEVDPTNGTSVLEGDVLTYTMKVTYPAIGVRNISMTDELPEGTLFVPGSIKYKLANDVNYTTVTNAAYSYSSNTITFPNIDLEEGLNYFQFQVVVDKLGTDVYEKKLENVAVLKSPNTTDVYESNKVTNTVISRGATIEKTAALVNEDDSLEHPDRGTAAAPVEAQNRQQVEYILTVTAVGDGTLVSGNIVVNDPLPKGTTPVTGSLTAKMLATAAGSTAGGLTSGDFATVGGATSATWTLTGMRTGDVAELRFRVYAPQTVDPVTKVALFDNQATLKDVEQSLLTFDKTAIRVERDELGKVTSAETVTESETVYSTEEVTKESEITYHVVKGVPHITAVKSADPAPAEAGDVPVVKTGDTITYTIQVTNDGNGMAYDVLVYDEIPAGTTYVANSVTGGGSYVNGHITWEIDEMDPAETLPLSFQVTVNGSDAPMLIENVAYYIDPEDPENPGEPDTWTPTPKAEHQAVVFTKSSLPDGGDDANGATRVEIGDKIDYTLTLNTAAELHNVTVSDVVPDGLALITDSITYHLADGTYRNLADSYLNKATRTITWPIVTTLPTGINTFTFSVIVERLDGEYMASYDNVGTVVYDDDVMDGAPVTMDSNHETHKTGVSLPEIHKTAALVVDDVAGTTDRGSKASPVVAQVGQQVEYILTVTGHGDDSDVLTVTDVMPEGTTFVTASGVNVEFTSPGNGGVTYQQTPTAANGKTLTVKIDNLSNGQTAMIRFRVTAPTLSAEEMEKFFDNTANMHVDGLNDKTYEETFTDSNGVSHRAGDPVYTQDEIDQTSETTYHVVRDSLLSAVKTSTPAYANGIAPIVKEGDEIVYSITVTNSGKANAENVFIRDSIPAGTIYKAGSADNGGAYDAANNRVQWMIDQITAGESVTVLFTVIVDEVTEASLIENVATYKEASDPENPDDPDEPWTNTNKTQHQTVLSVKSVSPDDETVREGQKLTYSIVVTVADTEGGVAKDVQVTDALPAGVSLVSESIKIGSAVQSNHCYQGGTITWPTVDLPVGDTTFSFEVVVDKLPEGTYSLEIANTAVVNEEPTEEVKQTVLSRTAHIAKEARVADDEGNVSADYANGTELTPVEVNCGDVIEYTLVVTNAGDENLASGDIVVTDVIPDNATLVPYSGSYEKEATSTATVSSMDYNATTGQVSWTINGMKGEEIIRLKFRVTASESVPAGVSVMVIINQAHMSDEDLKALVYEKTILNPDGTTKYEKYEEVYAEETEQDSNKTYHQVVKGTAVLEKAVDPMGNVKEGEILTYTLKATVTDNTVSDAIMTDVLPAGVSLVQGSMKLALAGQAETQLSDACYNPANRTITVAIASLPVGENTLTYEVMVDKLGAGVTKLELENNAILSVPGEPYQRTTVVNTVLSRSAEIRKTAALVLESGNLDDEKSGELSPVDTGLGQIVEYHIYVKNISDAALASGEIVVTDEIPEGTTLVSGSVSDGGVLGTDGKTITWTLHGIVAGEEKLVRFRVYAPTEVDQETNTYLFTNQASMKDTEVESRTWEKTVTVYNTDGTTTMRTENGTLYREEEVNKETIITQHIVKDADLSGNKISDRMTNGDETKMGATLKVDDIITYRG